MRLAGALVILLALSTPAIAKRLEGVVTKVRDGDTLVVALPHGVETIRLHGVDCPEGGQAYGGAARRTTQSLALGKRVTIVSKGRDRYGRVLGDVVLPDGRSLSAELIRRGMAWWYRRYAPRSPFAELEARARAKRAGLWNGVAPVPPWEFREQQRGTRPRDRGQPRRQPNSSIPARPQKGEGLASSGSYWTVPVLRI